MSNLKVSLTQKQSHRQQEKEKRNYHSWPTQLIFLYTHSLTFSTTQTELWISSTKPNVYSHNNKEIRKHSDSRKKSSQSGGWWWRAVSVGPKWIISGKFEVNLRFATSKASFVIVTSVVAVEAFSWTLQEKYKSTATGGEVQMAVTHKEVVNSMTQSGHHTHFPADTDKKDSKNMKVSHINALTISQHMNHFSKCTPPFSENCSFFKKMQANAHGPANTPASRGSSV